jgi:hypothetical protein
MKMDAILAIVSLKVHHKAPLSQKVSTQHLRSQLQKNQLQQHRQRCSRPLFVYQRHRAIQVVHSPHVTAELGLRLCGRQATPLNAPRATANRSVLRMLFQEIRHLLHPQTQHPRAKTMCSSSGLHQLVHVSLFFSFFSRFIGGSPLPTTERKLGNIIRSPALHASSSLLPSQCRILERIGSSCGLLSSVGFFRMQQATVFLASDPSPSPRASMPDVPSSQFRSHS